MSIAIKLMTEYVMRGLQEGSPILSDEVVAAQISEGVLGIHE